MSHGAKRFGNFQPWRKGPAIIIPFPAEPVRAIRVHRTPDGSGFMATFSDPGDGEAWRTEIGALDLVLAAVRSCELRRGAPIVIEQEVPA